MIKLDLFQDVKNITNELSKMPFFAESFLRFCSPL
jgi:hypothetical protein